MMIDVPGYNGKYKINECGIVINKTGHVMRPAVSNSGYLRTALEEPNSTKRYNKSIHRLVAQTFLPNPDNLPVVMHKDNDPLNNHVSNLQWGTQEENMQQAYREGRKFSPNKGKNKKYGYKVFNETEVIHCVGRSAVSDLIGYEEISLKNMVGNGRKIALGPYAGYEIRRADKPFVPISFKE